jgi:hypothetical protein
MANNTFGLITDEATYDRALLYIADQASHLAETVIGNSLPLDTLTVFTQTNDEYAAIEPLIRKRGEVSPYTHGDTLYVKTDSNIGGRNIKLLGVRRPDVARPERGYGDYPVDNFSVIERQAKTNSYMKPMQSGNGIKLIELTHPDFDVRGYIVGIER